MTIARSSAPQIGTTTALTDGLVNRVRLELGDPMYDAAGNLIPAAGRRHSDYNIILKINDTLLELGNKMAMSHTGDAMTFTTFSYAEDTGNEGDVLPSGINQEAITHVFDTTDANTPIELFYLNPLDLAKIPVSDPYSTTIARRYYTLIADTTTDLRIVVRPSASGRTFTIWYLVAPFVSDATALPSTDAPLLGARWKELIALGAAVRLLSINEEVPQTMLARYAAAMQDFISFSRRQKHPERVRMIRRFY